MYELEGRGFKQPVVRKGSFLPLFLKWIPHAPQEREKGFLVCLFFGFCFHPTDCHGVVATLPDHPVDLIRSLF